MATKGSELKSIVLEESAIGRCISRIAHEILESNDGTKDLCLVGIVTRGDLIAAKIYNRIKEIENVSLDVGRLDITFYRDDVGEFLTPQVYSSSIDFNIDGKTVVLVDDILYTGRTIRAALDALVDFGRPKAVRLAVLCDRGHRELPIRADFVGKNVPSARSEHIYYFNKLLDGREAVEIYSSGLSKDYPFSKNQFLSKTDPHDISTLNDAFAKAMKGCDN